ncbi:hypothetical protein E3N88_39156 [Mikania micrantha]|uniref:Uncharacterized protein n=1 Tax=Mikania micrantha TaxID=192012 RepID=A0A5N6LW01_9ASTR|nr:hypothetical protein E3N88_39156 [Mikania micrantha]
MAGFFSLGSAPYNHSQQDLTTNTNTIPTSHLNLAGSGNWIHDHHPTITVKDFEVWQQAPDARDFLARAAGASAGGGDDERFINFSYGSNWGSAGFMKIGHDGGGGGGGGGVNCRDCGNQAKKDCPHLRCRTCCKSRGFQCQTHVKSTWVPAAKRRERQQYLADTQQDHNRRRVLPTTKKPRSAQDLGNPNLATPIASATVTATAGATIAYNSYSGLDHFPTEVTTQGDFRCVRVSSIDETDDQFAYQAAVNIRGHLFKGILYDQGPESHQTGGDASSGGSAGILPLNLTSISPATPPVQQILWVIRYTLRSAVIIT